MNQHSIPIVADELLSSRDQLTAAGVVLRRITDDDLPFLYDVYASTRQEELAAVPWSAEQKEAFLRMQFDAQHRHYQEHYSDATFTIIEQRKVSIGRLYVAHWPKEVRIVDISILPAHRGSGVGTTLIEAIQAEAARAKKPVTIHVEQFNPARRLYERLGFRVVREVGAYFLMEWSP